ncbi:hypothetical protein A9Q83_14335 [Alphaproteobacteria bacterium 46_93_T64]|nr:hypothetical protein A9Q83_14335 [Alphaproteobacteria bacterium 46_93_T64]
MSNQENSSERKAQKSPDAFRTISEVSEELEIPQHVLRFWETKFPIVKPLKRGGGRRYYRPADIEVIRGIRDLLYTHGFTIKGAQKLLKEQGGRIENIELLSTGNAAVALKEKKPAPSSMIPEAPVGSAPVLKGSDDTRLHLAAILEELRAIRKLLPR